LRTYFWTGSETTEDVRGIVPAGAAGRGRGAEAVDGAISVGTRTVRVTCARASEVAGGVGVKDNGVGLELRSECTGGCSGDLGHLGPRHR